MPAVRSKSFRSQQQGKALIRPHSDFDVHRGFDSAVNRINPIAALFGDSFRQCVVGRPGRLTHQSCRVRLYRKP